MPECCIAYTTDSNYLFPTLVSAMQARRLTSTTDADVFIFCLKMTSVAERVFATICEGENIHLVPVGDEAVEGQTAQLARLFLHRFAPPHYRRYLYMDGDVHVHASLDPLVRTDLPHGTFLAVNDPSTFLLEDHTSLSRTLGSYIRALGLSPEQSLHYFNSGVLLIEAEGWKHTGEKAWKYFDRNRALCSRFQDQDALNAVACDHRLPLSLAWNFPVFMRNSRLGNHVRPRITHFMSSPKPWQGVFPPWTREAYEPYLAAQAKYPALSEFRFRMPVRRRATYHLQQRAKRALETVAWGFSERRQRILQYEAACTLNSATPPSEIRPWTQDNVRELGKPALL